MSAVIILLFSIGSIAWSGENVTGTQKNEPYIIGQGDILWISIWKNPDLTKEVIVLPDGTITFPLIGELKADGKTVLELKTSMEDKLKKFISNPVLTIMVQDPGSMFFYVVGKVNQPGKFVLKDNVSILQSLAMSGGPNPFADSDDIKVLRKEGDKTLIFNFNYNKVIKGKYLEQDIMLKRGDIVVVP
jgi:polysaccharide export outer membrane protein